MLKVNQLCKSYKTGSKTYPVLKNISFEINKGEFVAIMGSSGSGKTTLLNCISCFIPIDNGEIILGNNNIRNLKEKELSEVRNQQLGFVFQDFMLFDGLVSLKIYVFHKLSKVVKSYKWKTVQLIYVSYLVLNISEKNTLPKYLVEKNSVQQ
ncbi:putative aBC transporter ATP-binding protein [Clostridioides difficile P48]|nr:ATP-binding cassette domain-containing protein [Clostridioides difficile]EQJ87000.1 putative aBC transporter ATP-binding protein [Clostridioides difficile P48]